MAKPLDTAAEQARVRTPAKPRIGPVDVHVGKALRARRVSLGMTLEELAGLVGLTAQQVHKYELAQNRIPAARLNMLSQALRLPLAEFFAATAHSGSNWPVESEDLQFEVMRSLRTVREPTQQRLLLRLLRALIVEVTRS